MGFWKILGGAAMGVTTVVALPVAGPIGAITAVGALVAGAAGAAGAAAMDALDDSEEQAEKRSKEQAEKRGKEQAKAEYAQQLERFHHAIKEMASKMKSHDQYFGKIIAIAAVGISCANCDGEIHPAERTEIDEFVARINHSNLPEDVREKINKLWQNPPNITTAFKLSEKAEIDPSFLDRVICVAMHADNRVHAKEKAFMNAWNKLRNS